MQHGEEDAWTSYWRGMPPRIVDTVADGHWRAFFGRLPANARILDIGTGLMDVPLLAKQVSPGFELHAVDQADVDARRISGSEGIRFRRARADDTGYPDGHFDAVTGSYALEYTALKDGALDERALAGTLAELRRVMKPRALGNFLMHHPDSAISRQIRKDLVGLARINELGLYAKARDFLKDPSPSNFEVLRDATERLRKEHPHAGGTMARGFQVVLQAEQQRGSAVALDLLREFERTVLNDAARFESMQTVAGLDPQRVQRLLVEAGFDVDQTLTLEDGVSISGWAVQVRKNA
jgi:hypothetical protein